MKGIYILNPPRNEKPTEEVKPEVTKKKDISEKAEYLQERDPSKYGEEKLIRFNTISVNIKQLTYS